MSQKPWVVSTVCICENAVLVPRTPSPADGRVGDGRERAPEVCAEQLGQTCAGHVDLELAHGVDGDARAANVEPLSMVVAVVKVRSKQRERKAEGRESSSANRPSRAPLPRPRSSLATARQWTPGVRLSDEGQS